jgi:hypothetical protein
MDAYVLIVAPVAIYVAIGLAFAAAFVPFGVVRVDQGARGAGIGFRVLLVPGTVLLWPVLARRWLRARTAGMEKER